VHRKLFVAEAEQPEATVAFMRYDRDGSGFIGKSELAAFFEDVGIVQSTKTGATEEPGPVASARRMGLVDRALSSPMRMAMDCYRLQSSPSIMAASSPCCR
jgi:hypothetical protein